MSLQQLQIDEVFNLRDKVVFVCNGKVDKFLAGDVFECVDDLALTFRVAGIALINFRDTKAYLENRGYDLLVDELSSDPSDYKCKWFQKVATGSVSTSE